MPAPKTKTPNIKQLTSDLSLLKKIAYRLWHYRQGTVITDAHKTRCEITQEVLALAGRLLEDVVKEAPKNREEVVKRRFV
jgi:hypothetical protein